MKNIVFKNTLLSLLIFGLQSCAVYKTYKNLNDVHNWVLDESNTKNMQLTSNGLLVMRCGINEDCSKIEYIGDTLGIYAHGKGNAKWFNTKGKLIAEYNGDFQYGLFSGKGKVTYYAINTYFEGQWDKGYPVYGNSFCLLTKSNSNIKTEPIQSSTTSQNAQGLDPTPRATEPDPDEFVKVDKEPNFDYLKLQQNVKYPNIASKNSITGSFMLKILLKKDGTIGRCLNDCDKNNMVENNIYLPLLLSAYNSLQTVTFTPAIQKGQPVEVWVIIPFSFRLR
ncbi:MAG: hypothetical protein U0Y96_11355 [Candidatus Kapaibacterium sp.]